LISAAPHGPVRIRRYHLKSKRAQAREHELHRLPPVKLACDPGNLTPMRRGNDRLTFSRQVSLDNVRNSRRARLIIQIAQQGSKCGSSTKTLGRDETVHQNGVYWCLWHSRRDQAQNQAAENMSGEV
jgi:hypothetical protein